MTDRKQQQRIVDAVFGFLPGCPEASIRSVVDMTVEEFAKNVGGIVENTPNYRFEAGSESYRVPAPFAGRILQVRKVYVRDDEMDPAYWTAVQDGNDIVLSFKGYGGVRVASDLSWRARVAWLPTARTPMLPTWWFDRYESTIKYGVLATLLSQNAPWGNAANATRFIKEYETGIHDALVDVRQNEMRGGVMSMLDRHNPFIPKF